MEPANRPSAPQPPNLPHLQVRYCGIHGLVIGPEGRCIICKRNMAEPAANDGRRTLIGAVLAAAALAGVALVYKGASRAAAPPPPTALPPPAVAAAHPAETPPATEDPDEYDREQAKGEAELARGVAKEEALEEATHRVKVRIYVTDACTLCRDAEAYLKDKGVPFTVLDIEQDSAALAALQKLRAEPMVPTFEVDGEIVVGFGTREMDGAIARAAQRRTR